MRELFVFCGVVTLLAGGDTRHIYADSVLCCSHDDGLQVTCDCDVQFAHCDIPQEVLRDARSRPPALGRCSAHPRQRARRVRLI